MTLPTAAIASILAIGGLFSHLSNSSKAQEKPSFHTIAQEVSATSDYRREYNVQVVYFYPKNYKPNVWYLSKVDPFMKDVQRWYLAKLGVTFNLQRSKVVRGQYEADFYNDPSALFPGQRVLQELGVDCGTKTVTIVLVARTLHHGNGRSCGPFYAGADNGDVTVSEATFDPDITGYCPGVRPEDYYWACNKGAKRRSIAHELGHAFSLPHPQNCETVGGEHCSKTVMWSYWAPEVGFLDAPSDPAPSGIYAPEHSTLINSPWFWKTTVR